jgi:capsular exopolysaccharide synthesis family protein
MSKEKLNWTYGDDFFKKRDSGTFEKVFNKPIPSASTPAMEPMRSKDLGLLGYNSEYFETLRDNIVLPIEQTSERPSQIAITSSDFNEGVSTIASQLAVTFARREGANVLLVDTNFAKPSIHAFFGLELSPGLGEVMIDQYDYKMAIKPSPFSDLSILTAGDIHVNPTSKYDSPQFAEMLAEWRRQYTYVIFDTPPMQCDMKQCDMNSSVRLASLVDGIIMVIESERVRREVAIRMKERLLLSNANILGVVLNKKKLYIPGFIYKLV